MSGRIQLATAGTVLAVTQDTPIMGYTPEMRREQDEQRAKEAAETEKRRQKLCADLSVAPKSWLRSFRMWTNNCPKPTTEQRAASPNLKEEPKPAPEPQNKYVPLRYRGEDWADQGYRSIR